MGNFLARARLTSAALFVALAFVVVGVLRADREMVRAEQDRATLFAAQTATRVESYLLRRIVHLEASVQAIDEQLAGSETVPRQDPAFVIGAREAAGFDALWLWHMRSNDARIMRVKVSDSTDSPPQEVEMPSTIVRARVLKERDFARRSPSIFPDRISGSLYFVQQLGSNPELALVGAASLDSLRELLRRQRYADLSRISVRVGADTLLSIAGTPAGTPAPALGRLVDVPFDTTWSIEMVYVPTGRGMRLALWVVGLGAIVGLGVGLLLERREVRRLADRSSELEHLSTELLRANRAKSEFLANVSHELRTPLNAIVGFVDLLRDGVYGPLNLRQTGPVERIEASANHLRHLVDQILDLAKIAAGRLEVHAETLELRPFVFDVASEVEPLMSEKGLSFSLAVGASLPRVRTDPTHLRQILINLLGNAVKFTNTGGISVRGRLIGAPDHRDTPSILNGTSTRVHAPKQEGIWIALQVADSGIGIPDKDRERIFDEFEQVNAGPRGDSMRRGTGLGLSISRRLARLLGGDITVESEIGRGSVFTVWLPVDPGDLQGNRAA